MVEPKGQYYYDALYRLTKAKGRELNSLALPTHTDMTNDMALPNTAANAMQNFTQEYTYDELGNMMQLKSLGQWTRDYFYNHSQNNYLLGHTDGQTDYTYDAHGNMLSMPHLQAMHWDYNDWLTHVDLDATGNKANYMYDSAGERVRKVVEKGNIKEERLYFGDYEIYRKFVSGVLETERTTVNISDDKAKIATVDTLTVDQGSLTVNPVAVIRYQLDNHLGSASLELDESADIITYEEYHPFGTTSYQKLNGNISQKRYKYVGKEHDNETGLYYYGARYYASWLCRFVSVDPLAIKRQWLTPYNYVQNNPINRIDPTGALDEDPPNLIYHSNSRDITDSNGNIIGHESNSLFIIGNEDGSCTFRYSSTKLVTNGDGISIAEREFNVTAKDFDHLSDFQKEVIQKYLNTRNRSNASLNLPDYSKNDGIILGEDANSEDSNGFGLKDALLTSMSVAGVIGDGIHDIMVDRGKYLPRNAQTITGKWYSIKKTGDIVIRSRVANITANAKYLNYARIGGKVLGTLGNAVTIIPASYDAYTDPTAGNIASLAVKSIAIGAAFIPVVGWAISIGIGVADAIWGDQFYKWIDENKDSIRNPIMQMHDLHSKDGTMMAPWLYGK